MECREHSVNIYGKVLGFGVISPVLIWSQHKIVIRMAIMNGGKP
jgi:hypothetical protein